MSDAIDSKRLYAELLALTGEGSPFYFKDYGLYRVFNYRLASYTDFLKPSALEARGVMFYMEEGKEPVLVCRPFKKFFNRNENPFTMNLDLTQVRKWAVKEDGSIITSYLEAGVGELKVKSKQSLYSEQTAMATTFLDRPENADLKKDTEAVTRLGNTVIFELVSPMNRIVIDYPKTELRVLGVRSNHMGNCYSKYLWKDSHPALYFHWVKEFGGKEINAEEVAKMTGIEGFIGIMEDGLMFKDKTDWYKALHHLKDGVNSPRNMFNAIIDEAIDDAKSMYSTDASFIQRIVDMENIILPVYNNMISFVEKFYEDNKHLERKEYAIKGQAEAKGLFSLVMGKYTGKGSTYQDFAKKYHKEVFGISFAEEQPEED